MAETINGLFKAEVINRQSWRSIEAVELATLAGSTGSVPVASSSPSAIPPAEAETAYYAALELMPIAA